MFTQKVLQLETKLKVVKLCFCRFCGKNAFIPSDRKEVDCNPDSDIILWRMCMYGNDGNEGLRSVCALHSDLFSILVVL